MPDFANVLACHVVSNPHNGHTRDVWLLPPAAATRPARLCVFLDAELYITEVNCLPILEALSSRTSAAYAFVSSASAEARHHDYTWNERYADFIATDVVESIKTRIRISQDGHVICGLSLSGLESACVAFNHPGVFTAALCQSASFWWFDQNEPRLPPTRAKFWLSVGREETATDVVHPPTGLRQSVSQIVGVERAVKSFRAAGADVKFTMHDGGHSPSAWREELLAALDWLIPNP